MTVTLKSRRDIMALFGSGAAFIALSGCTIGRKAEDEPVETKGKKKKKKSSMGPLSLSATGDPEDYKGMYGPFTDGGFKLPAIPYEKVPEQFRRQIVDNTTGYPEGTIVVEIGRAHV